MDPLREWLQAAWERLRAYIVVLNQQEITFKQRVFRYFLAWLAGYYLVSTLFKRPRQQPLPRANLESKPVITWKPFSHFLALVEERKVAKVWFGDDDVLQFSLVDSAEGATKAAKEVLVTRRVPSHLLPFARELHASKVEMEQVPRNILANTDASSAAPLWQSVLMVALPVAYISLFGYAIYRVFGNGGMNNDPLNNNASFGKRQTKQTKTGFADVQGVNAARDAVREVCTVLQNPERYARAGARLPTGLLMVGPPGTGKTMMARAMANEAGLPFFYCNGSEFVEVYSGRGAARVRALFEKAEKQAPAIVFIDEIDALGGARGGHQNNEEREQTLNQLLCCMDGFDTEKRLVVIGATNRFDYLDKALVRPGRFDRIVRVDLPDAAGRLAILTVHTRDMRLNDSVSLAQVAKECGEGWSGAELASLANEAAIRAVRNGREIVDMEDFRDALRMYSESRKKKRATTSSTSSSEGLNWTSFFQNLGQQQQQPKRGDDEEEEDRFPEAEELD